MKPSIEIFCCAADEDESFLTRLKSQLEQAVPDGSVVLWDKSLIAPGENTRDTIRFHLEQAGVFLLLISADFLASPYWKATLSKTVLERYKIGDARIIPVLVHSVNWENGGLKDIQPLPRHQVPISSYSPEQQEAILRDVAQEITQIIHRPFSPGPGSSTSDMPTAPSWRVLSQTTPFSSVAPFSVPVNHKRARRFAAPGRILFGAACVVLLVIALLEGFFYANTQQELIQVHATATTQARQFNAAATAQIQRSNADATTTALASTAASEPPTGFIVTSLADGQRIQNGTIITIQGSYNEKGSEQVWVLLNDNFGNYYLQNRPVDFLSGNSWMVENIHPAKGITNVLFVSVTSTGSTILQGMVQMNSFQAFTQFPDGSQILQKIPIVVF